MFKQKKESLRDKTFGNPLKVDSKKNNLFLEEGMRVSAETLSENGALKYKTTGSGFVDQFSKTGSYKEERDFSLIVDDCELLWASNPLLCVMFIIYLRTITRVTNLLNGDSTKESQKGAGMRYESIMRMIWLHQKSPESFWKNIGLFISVGCWKDIIQMLSLDLQYHGWKDRILNWDKIGDLLLSGLKNDSSRELIKKYLPQIKANSQCKTVESEADNIIAKWICGLLFGNKQNETGTTYKHYRKLKTSGTAHEWQKLISQRKFNEIDFNSIHGRALSLLVKGKFLTNQGLKDKYTAWVQKPETKLKYTGFVNELFINCSKYRNIINIPVYEQETINKQFDTLVKKAGEKPQNKLIVVRDTSGSMSSIATGTQMSCGNIAKSMALFFSEFLEGRFQNHWIEFNETAQLNEWKGNTTIEKWYNDKASYIGSTNFQSVINLFGRLKREGVPESEFPSGILCISDGEFNKTALNTTNVEAAKKALIENGFSEKYVSNFVIVLWNLQSQGRGNKFETFSGEVGTFYFSGYDPSVISFLTGKIKTPDELFLAAMQQEVIQMVEL